MMRISFIINSTSRNIDKLVLELESHQHSLIREAKFLKTEYKGHARDLAQNEALETDLIIAVGGDGTLHEVVDGIMGADLAIEKRPAVALIPRGSANDFARMQNIPKDLDGTLKAIEHGAFVKTDVGRIQLMSTGTSHYFINVADSGFGAEVVQRMEENIFFRKILSSNLRFALAILWTFLAYKRKRVEILTDNEVQIRGRVLTLVVANSSAFASGLIVAPEARIDDGQFHLLVGDINLLGYLANIGRLRKGKKLTLKGVKYLEASKVRISGPVDLQTEADGELIGSGDVEIECIPGAIKFYLPGGRT